jgi:hypothetical protein
MPHRCRLKLCQKNKILRVCNTERAEATEAPLFSLVRQAKPD